MNKMVTLKKNYEFGRVYKKGRFFVGKYLILYALPNRIHINRIGITTSKKVGKSVRRNRLRRLIRENYRAFEAFVLSGYDLVFVARATDEQPQLNDIKKEMKYLFKRLKVFDQEKWDASKSCL